jgi:competence protein ComEC
MTCAALAALLPFSAGVVVLQQQGALPSPVWALLLLPLIAVCARYRAALAGVSLAAGFFWAALYAQVRMSDWLSPELEGRDLEVIGVVSSLPAPNEHGVRFEFELESAGLPRKVLLGWYRSPTPEEPVPLVSEPVHPGERWLFTVRLRRPHGQVNPNGFDYEAWLLERGIGATGYVRPRGQQRLLGRRDSVMDRVEQAREAVRNRFQAALGATPAAGILSALAIGEQRAIAAEEWRLFSRTGVTHLMSISGLHVTLVSGLAAWLVSALWRRAPRLTVRLPARKAAAAAAVIAALGYTVLAGFAVPAQRTFYMVAVVALALWTGGIASPVATLAAALAVVLLVDPWAPLSPGFWLSFGAVSLIFYVAAGWTRREHRLLQWGRVQWAITLGLSPAVLLLFGQVSVAGPLANAVAIPVVSAVVTPLALLAALVPADFLLAVAAWLVEWLLQFLEACAALPGALWQTHRPAPWTVAVALAGVGWMLAPRGIPGRICGVALLAPAFAVPPPGPSPGEAWITIFDVGQGLAVMVRTASRTLLYDTGPAFGADADSGARIVVPELRARGASHVDLLVLSHEDLDHVGGALSVLESIEVQALASSLPERHALNALAHSPRRCYSGETWEWDGVRFDFLHPRRGDAAMRRNNQSCVLKVTATGASMLLTGDIERLAELSLAVNPGVKADVLLAPHHGSRSSSSAELIAAVRPRFAVVASGYRNRFGHPNAEVLERYRAAGVTVLRTDRQGAVHITLRHAGAIVEAERARTPRYWRMPRV